MEANSQFYVIVFTTDQYPRRNPITCMEWDECYSTVGSLLEEGIPEGEMLIVSTHSNTIKSVYAGINPPTTKEYWKVEDVLWLGEYFSSKE